MVLFFLARVPAMTDPPNTTITPRLPGSRAQTTLSRRFFLASVISFEMGCWEPVRMMGLSASCTR